MSSLRLHTFVAVCCFTLATGAGVQAAPSAPAASTKPKNVVMVLVDDLGYETLGIDGGKSYPTPNLDRIGREGVRFDFCFAQPNCTPTRTQLMTGKSNVRNYVSFGHLEESQKTFGNIFHDAGYATCIAGKWQLGSKAGLAEHFGFDEHCLWSYLGRGERYANPTLTINGAVKPLPGEYGPDVCQKFVFDFLKRQKGKPFFLYYPMILTHGAYEATPDSADYGTADAKSKGKKGKAVSQRHFGDMVAYMDKLVGALQRELAANGQLENTLLLFTGDNGTGTGATTELSDGSEMEGGKGSTSMRGMHVPLLVSWAGHLPAGKVCRDLVDMTDFLPTISEATGLALPKDYITDGHSFWPQATGKPGKPRDWIYSFWVPLRERQMEHIGSRGAVEQAFNHDFKLYSTGEFFDLRHDIEEEHKLPVSGLKDEAAAAAKTLQVALDQFRDARPADLANPKNPAGKSEKKAEKKEKKEPKKSA